MGFMFGVQHFGNLTQKYFNILYTNLGFPSEDGQYLVGV